MKRKLIIEGNAVYELDENCMLTKRLEEEKQKKKEKKYAEIERRKNSR